MALRNPENYYQWRHFLSSLQKSTKNFTPETQKDVFLGDIDCFSTNLSRRLLGTSGQSIETELPHSSLKKLKTSAFGYNGKYDYIPGSTGRSEEAEKRATTPSHNTLINKHHASGTTKRKMFSEILGMDKPDDKSSTESEEGTQNGSCKENVSDVVQFESNAIPPADIPREHTSRLSESDLLEASRSGIEVPVEKKCDRELSEKQLKVTQEVTHPSCGLVSSVQGLGEVATSTDFCKLEANEKEIKSEGRLWKKDSHVGPGEEPATSSDLTICKLETNGKEIKSEECRWKKDSHVEEHMAKLHTLLPAAAFSHIKENIETNRIRQRNKNTNKRKIDVDIPCCQWTLEMLSKYVDFTQSVDKIEQPNELGCSPKVIGRIVKRTLNQIKTVQRVIFTRNKSSAGHRQPKTGSGDIYDLSDIRGTEADVRILLDAILIPFAEEMQLNIETEKSYKNNNLPNCTFDYLIHYKDDVVGLVETKSRLHGNGLGPESVVQGILQLAALQAEVYGRRTRTLPTNQQLAPLSLFNIISDGYQFIFIQLDHEKLHFDHQPGKNIFGEAMPTIRFYVMDSLEGIREVLEKLAKHLFEVKHCIDQAEKGENNEVEDETDEEKIEDETDDEEIEIYETDGEGTIILD